MSKRAATLRRFIIAFGLSSAVLVSVSYSLFIRDTEHRASMARDEEAHAVEMRYAAVSKSLRAATADLLLLVDLTRLTELSVEDTPNRRADLTRETLAFMRERATYRQVWILDSSGEAIADVVRDEGNPVVLPTSASGSLDELVGLRGVAEFGIGTLLVSDMDLRTDNGSPVRPLDPVVLLGMTLRRDDGSVVSTVILGVVGNSVLQDLAEAHPEALSKSMLLDHDGYWISAEDPALEWGSVLPERRRAGLQFSLPREWREIAAGDAGQFETRNGLFTYRAIYPRVEVGAAAADLSGTRQLGPLGPGAGIRWTILSQLPAAEFRGFKYAGAVWFLVSNGFGLLAIGFGSLWLAQWMSRSQALRRRVESENRLLSSTLGRYLPQGVSARILGDPVRYAKLGGEMKQVAVLFADIRGFTSFSETRSPDVVVAALNRALSEITSPVLRHGGILDKYVGDGLLAFFESTNGPKDAARRAVTAAKEMQAAFGRLGSETAVEALAGLGLGIGISVGQVVVGNIGSQEVMNHTIIGDAVNVAARLQALAESGQILLTESAYELARDERSSFVARTVTLKGRRRAVNVYRLCGDSPAT